MLRRAVSFAVVLAVLVAFPASRRRRELRPLAALALLALIGDPLGAALTRDIVAAQDGMRAADLDPLVAPLTGWARAEGHAMQALTLSWAPALSAAVAVLFARRARVALAVWVVAVLVMVLGYHHLRGLAARPVYLATDLAALVAGVHAAVRWAWLRRSPELHHIAGLALLLFEGARLLAYHGGPWTTWDVARVPLLCQFAVIAFGGALCCCRSSSRFA